MRNHHLVPRAIAAVIAAGLTFPTMVQGDVARDRAGAIETTSEGAQLSHNQRELIEFQITLAALDDALMRNHLENYYTLNARLKGMMERELNQSRTRVHDAEKAKQRYRSEMRAQHMKATMGGSGTDFLDLPDNRSEVRDEHHDIASLKKRRDTMEKLIDRFEDLRLSVYEADQRAYARNAALLDNFFKVMRAENAAANAERKDR